MKIEIPVSVGELLDKISILEIKAFLSTTITLMTPEPDFGYRYEQGLTSFLYKNSCIL